MDIDVRKVDEVTFELDVPYRKSTVVSFKLEYMKYVKLNEIATEMSRAMGKTVTMSDILRKLLDIFFEEYDNAKVEAKKKLLREKNRELIKKLAEAAGITQQTLEKYIDEITQSIEKLL